VSRLAQLIPMFADYSSTHFMLGNCLWKMYTGGNRSGSLSSKAVNKILASFLKAVEHTPPRKDPNRQDPILEPINKLVSIVHKLRMDHDVDARFSFPHSRLLLIF